MKMEEWKKVRLGDVCSFQEGYVNPSQNNSEYFDGPIKWLRATDLNNGFVYNTTRTLSQKGFDSAGKSALLFKPDTIGISKSGTIGRLGILKDYMCGNRAVINIVPNTEVDTMFIFYTLLNMQGKFENLAVGSVQKNLYVPILAEIKIKLPPLPTQQKIAAILSSLDDKIELNNKINTNLEQQAGALFKNWFVDFEPFGGKMPEGWKEADIYSIANIIYGSPFASKLFNTEKNGKPIIRIRDLKDQHSDVYTPEERDDAYLIQPKDIVVGMDGEFRPYIWGSEPGWLNQRVCVFKNKRPKGKAFLYFSIKPLLDVVEKTQVATTVIHIGKKDFDKFQITLPTEDILDKFDELTDPILDQIVANRLENHRLAELRNTLLPKLMNGEIEVNKK